MASNGMALSDVIRFLILVLRRWSQQRQFGEIRIVVQEGQVQFVHQTASFHGYLPKGGPSGDEARRLADQAINAVR